MLELRIENLFARRSIRQFTDEIVDPSQIDLLLKAAMAAPSAGDRKPWHFVVVSDPVLRRALSEAHPHAKMAMQAPLCIVPCGIPAESIPGRNEYWVQDLAAATENILLAAAGLGLGAVWCGVYPIQERIEALRRILSIPEEAVPFAIVPIGHPAEEKPPRTQYDSTRVHENIW